MRQKRRACKSGVSPASRSPTVTAQAGTGTGISPQDLESALGNVKVPDVTCQDVVALMKKREKAPNGTNRVLACLRMLFNMAGV